jgi:hypothetical protein
LFARTANGQTVRRQIWWLVRQSQGRPIEIELPSGPPDATAVREARSVLRARLLVVRRQLEELLPEAAVRYLREAIAAEIKRLSV